MITKSGNRGWRGRLIAAAVALMISGGAMATCGPTSFQGAISYLYVQSDGFYIALNGGHSGLTNCTQVAGVYLTLAKTHANYSSLYALLLVAKTTGEQISIRTNDGSNGCTVAYMTTP